MQRISCSTRPERPPHCRMVRKSGMPGLARMCSNSAHHILRMPRDGMVTTVTLPYDDGKNELQEGPT